MEERVFSCTSQWFTQCWGEGEERRGGRRGEGGEDELIWRVFLAPVNNLPQVGGRGMRKG